MERAIARITVGLLGQAPISQGTGFLVSAEGLVLTALHVVADLAQSQRNGRLSPYPAVGFGPHVAADRRVGTATNPPIVLRFGHPNKTAVWQPAGPVWIVDGLYDLTEDWAVLGFADAVPDDVAPLELSDLRKGFNDEGWQTLGFPASAPTGDLYDGTFARCDQRTMQLTSLQAMGDTLAGISGAPCVAHGQAVGVIYEARLRGGASVGGRITALPLAVVAKAAGGRLPFAAKVPVPFELPVLGALSAMPAASVDRAGQMLRLPADKRHLDHVVRALILAGVRPAAGVLATVGATKVGRELLPMIAAAQLHHEAVTLLAAAAAGRRPSALQAGDERVCAWYTDRACHAIEAPRWGKKLLHVTVGGLLDEVPAAPGESAIEAVVAKALRHLRERAAELIKDETDPEDAADVRDFWKSALAGSPACPFCVALHGEKRVEVVLALAAKLPNAHVLMVRDAPPELDVAARALIATIAPHVEDEPGLVADYVAARTSLK